MLDDYKEIERKLINYGIALDSRNWDKLNTIFSKDVSAVYGNEKIGMMIESQSRDEIINMCKASLGGCGTTQHLLGNFRIDITGETAESKCYVRAYHVGNIPNESEYYEMWGEYQDDWTKVNGEWLIIKRRLRVDNETGNRDKVLAPE
tara:strand:+ start:1281 stop:1724 length:444 start_codon:yes stop_codon:yes gene_type:complete